MKLRSEVHTGEPGTGKSLALVQNLIENIHFQFWADRSKATVRERILRDPYAKYLYCDLDELACDVPVEPLQISEDDDLNQRYRETAIEVLQSRNTEKMNEISKGEDGLDCAMHAVQLAKTTPDMVYEFLSPVGDLASIPESPVKDRLETWQAFHPATNHKQIGPAYRAARPLARAELKVRYGATLNYSRMIKDGVKLCVVGGTPEIFKAVVGTHLYRITEQLRTTPMIADIILEEYVADELLFPVVEAFLLTGRKFGCAFYLLSPTEHPDPEKARLVNQTCLRQCIYRCGDPVLAEQKAKMLRALVDSNKVHHTTERTITDGYETVKVGDKEVRQARHFPITDKHYDSRQDQIFDISGQIQQLKIGERFVYEAGACYKELLPPPEPITVWGNEDEVFEQWKENHHNNDTYFSTHQQDSTTKPDEEQRSNILPFTPLQPFTWWQPDSSFRTRQRRGH